MRAAIAVAAVDKPNIVILATGGTIAGPAENQPQAAYASRELNPARSRVLLKLALLKTSDPVEIQEYFEMY